MGCREAASHHAVYLVCDAYESIESISDKALGQIFFSEMVLKFQTRLMRHCGPFYSCSDWLIHVRVCFVN